MAGSNPGPSNEQIFRRKLLMDGQGMGDSKRLDFLLDCFLQWCDDKSQTPEEIKDGYDYLQYILNHIELSAHKSHEHELVNEDEVKNYDETCSEIESKIEEAKKDVAKRREELSVARQLKKKKLQIDALARIVEQQPDRKETLERLDQVQQDINYVASRNEAVEKKLENYATQLDVLLTSAYELKSKLRAELEEWEDSESD